MKIWTAETEAARVGGPPPQAVGKGHGYVLVGVPEKSARKRCSFPERFQGDGADESDPEHQQHREKSPGRRHRLCESQREMILGEVVMPEVGRALFGRAVAAARRLYDSRSRGQAHLLQVRKQLRDWDIVERLRFLESLVGHFERASAPPTVRLAVESLEEAVREVDASLQLVQNALEYHESKFFHSWRGCDFSEPLALLTQSVVTVSLREERLLRIAALRFGTRASFPV